MDSSTSAVPITWMDPFPLVSIFFLKCVWGFLDNFIFIFKFFYIMNLDLFEIYKKKINLFRDFSKKKLIL